MTAGIRFAIHEAPGETRAAALEETGRPIGLFIERWGGEGEPSRSGDIVLARLRQQAAGDGGAFFETAAGEEVFVRGDLPGSLTEGAEAQLEIVAGARRGKLARGRLETSGGAAGLSRLERWAAAIPGAVAQPEFEAGEDARDDIARAIDEALSQKAGLPGGGLIQISRTAAVVAIDIDTAGRQSRGSAGARAFSVNREAVREAARQMALRGLGGLIVIDCVAPINAEAGQKLRLEFIEAFSSVSGRSVEALRPSRFGLLEAKIAWGDSPLEDRLLDESGAPTGETELLDLLRSAERDAESDRSAFFSLTLSPAAQKAYIARRESCDRILQSRFSGRVSVSRETDERSSVRRI